jgi:hypothetical protein
MAGAIAGAVRGTDGFPASAISVIETVNELRIAALVDPLLALRAR